MGKKFEIVFESDINGTPQQVFEAATTGNAGWLWPMEVEPRVGGAGPFGSTVTVWEPPRAFANHVEGENGFFNDLSYTIEERPGGRAFLRYVHSGIFFEDWDNQYDGARAHTEFYQHTLGQYVQHFPGRQAAFADVQGPPASAAPNAFAALRSAFGLDRVAQGEVVTVNLPGVGPTEATVDFSNEHFLGLRTNDAMYRFFGRNAFGGVVGVTVHLFADGADAAAVSFAFQEWLDQLYS